MLLLQLLLLLYHLLLLLQLPTEQSTYTFTATTTTTTTTTRTMIAPAHNIVSENTKDHDILQYIKVNCCTSHSKTVEYNII